MTSLKRILAFGGLALLSSSGSFARDYYVSPTGADTNEGTLEKPFQTIRKAAALLQPGDTCYLREGTYREWVKPLRGGTSEDRRIVYKAYAGETPVLKGSERVTTWVKERGNVWRADISDNLIGPFNPYYLHVIGAYMKSGSENHLGDVYLNGKVLDEKYSRTAIDEPADTWFAEHHYATTTIWANFGGADPNAELAEILVREGVFAPAIPGLGYITIDGLTIQHGASNWAANTQDQKGMVNLMAGHHWIVQNCHIADAKCVGLCSGFASSTETADIDSYGHNIARNNLIERCGQAAIIGNQGWSTGLIEGNLIQDIDYRQRFTGDEMSAIKFHMAMDVTIRNNVIRRVHNGNGIWADWGNSGVRITGNVIYDIYDWKVVFFEMNHGPLIVDNNVFIGQPLATTSERMVYAHNLAVDSGVTSSQEDVARAGSPVWQPHTKIPVDRKVMCTATLNDRYFNNIFIGGRGLRAVGSSYQSGYNVYWQGAPGNSLDTRSIVEDAFQAKFTRTDLPDGVKISFEANDAPRKVGALLVTHDLIGVDAVVKQGLEDHEGKPFDLDHDLDGAARRGSPVAGPFASLKNGLNSFVITAGPSAAGRSN